MKTKSTIEVVAQARKNAAWYAVAFATLAVTSKFVWESDFAFIITGALFVLTCWYIVRVGALHRKADSIAQERALHRSHKHDQAAVGVLGNYQVDGGTRYGLFANFGGTQVFVDLKKDTLQSEREVFAKAIAASAERLQEDFQLYVKNSKQLAAYDSARLAIHTFGCYSKQPNSAEVYLLLDGRDDGLACLFDGTAYRDL